MFDAFIVAIAFPFVVWAVLRGLVHLISYTNAVAKGGRPDFFPNTSYCDRCEKNIPRTKRLKSFQDRIFGGWACPKCGSEFDTLGNVRVARSHDGHLRDSRRRARRKKIAILSEDNKTPLERLIDE